jgi:S-formylglutathione hydrolase FrmB
MKPGALGKHESYLLELIGHIESRSSYRDRVLPRRGVGGVSMGGLGAIKLGLKYPDLFQSMSSQSGLLDLELLKNKWMLKMLMPEFLEVFGQLDAKSLPPVSSLAPGHLRANYSGITEGNRNFERAIGEGSHQIPAQMFNGRAGHNYQFWRSRLGNVLRHHSDQLK